MFSTKHRVKAGETHGGMRWVLGFASVAVGLTELLAPEKVEKTMGVSTRGENTGILRVLGLRELAHGFDLLAHRNATPGILGRAAGDMLDGVLLGAAAKNSRNVKGMAMIAALVMPLVLADMVMGPKSMKRS